MAAEQIVARAIDARWTKQQVKSFVRDVRREVGNGWSWLTPRVQHALMAERAFAVVRHNLAPVTIEEMDCLLAAMLVESGLEEEVLSKKAKETL